MRETKAAFLGTCNVISTRQNWQILAFLRQIQEGQRLPQNSLFELLPLCFLAISKRGVTRRPCNNFQRWTVLRQA